VGDDAVIGMGAMIRADVAAGETWVGNPGRRLS
jgi:serine acetyltransferase